MPSLSRGPTAQGLAKGVIASRALRRLGPTAAISVEMGGQKQNGKTQIFYHDRRASLNRQVGRGANLTKKCRRGPASVPRKKQRLLQPTAASFAIARRRCGPAS